MKFIKGLLIAVLLIVTAPILSRTAQHISLQQLLAAAQQNQTKHSNPGLAQMKQFDPQQIRSLVNKKNASGMTALMYAAGTGNLPMVKWLVKMGANINNDKSGRAQDWTAIMYAIYAGKNHHDFSVAEWLINHASSLKGQTTNLMHQALTPGARKQYDIKLYEFAKANGAPDTLLELIKSKS